MFGVTTSDDYQPVTWVGRHPVHVTTLLDELRTEATDGGPAMLDREGLQEMLEVIDEEADRLNRFIEGMVELARIEAGEMRLRRRWGLA